MARIDDLLAHVRDEKLRAQLSRAVNDLRKRKKFGLVYEEHIPETVLLASETGVRPGASVSLRREPTSAKRYKVEKVNNGKATLSSGDTTIQAKTSDLLVVTPFGRPVYPVLESLSKAVGRSPEKPFHVVINGENFHALQLLLFGYEGKVDFIYIDPPYNTGARDWKYNNDYVDSQDSWRHSKWLSMVERRLRLAKKLLATDGILVVTIDEHEVNNLGVLLREDIFKELAQEAIQMVTIVINPKGVTQGRFSRVEEYAFFVFLGGAGVSSIGDDLLTIGADDLERAAKSEGLEKRPRWKGLLRSGTNARRVDRQNLFYPVLIDANREAVLDAGDPLPLGEAPNFKRKIRGLSPVWPVRRDGSLGNWGVGHTTLKELIAKGFVALGSHDATRNTWGITYLSKEPQEQIAAGILTIKEFDPTRNRVDVVYADVTAAGRRMKTVWHRTRHDAGTGGTDILRAFLGGRAFSFPKSLYAVRDTLAAVVGNRPNAVIVDFFAGSGTTLHATALLNSVDGGHRRCILVGNNEVSEEAALELRSKGLFQGDKQYEQRGVFQSVTVPRVRAALTGNRADKAPVAGEYLGGRLYSEGFDENAAFFELRYRDPDEIDAGERLDDILPALWLAAGAIGNPEELKAGKRWLMSDTAPLAVLLDEDFLHDFCAALKVRTNISHVWLVTDSEGAFARMRTRIPGKRVIGMLYRDYLRNFQINTDHRR